MLCIYVICFFMLNVRWWLGGRGGPNGNVRVKTVAPIMRNDDSRTENRERRGVDYKITQNEQ